MPNFFKQCPRNHGKTSKPNCLPCGKLLPALNINSCICHSGSGHRLHLPLTLPLVSGKGRKCLLMPRLLCLDQLSSHATFACITVSIQLVVQHGHRMPVLVIGESDVSLSEGPLCMHGLSVISHSTPLRVS